MDLHPAENRGYRELFLTSRQAARRLEGLASAFEGDDAADALRRGAELLLKMLDDLRPAIESHGLYSRHAAEGSGTRFGWLRLNVVDRFLERNQALRLAVYDLEHAATLLAYLANVSETRGDLELPELDRSWERRLRRQLAAVRHAAVDIGTDPDVAVAPLDDSMSGRAAHRAAWAMGTVGEWTDRQAGRRKRP